MKAAHGPRQQSGKIKNTDACEHPFSVPSLFRRARRRGRLGETCHFHSLTRRVRVGRTSAVCPLALTACCPRHPPRDRPAMTVRIIVFAVHCSADMPACCVTDVCKEKDSAQRPMPTMQAGMAQVIPRQTRSVPVPSESTDKKADQQRPANRGGKRQRSKQGTVQGSRDQRSGKKAEYSRKNQKQGPLIHRQPQTRCPDQLDIAKAKAVTSPQPAIGASQPPGGEESQTRRQNRRAQAGPDPTPPRQPQGRRYRPLPGRE